MTQVRAHLKAVIGLALLVLVNGVMAYVLYVDKLHEQQTYVNDFMMRNSTQVPDPRIVVVAIDDQSIKDYGRLGNWDHGHYADLIRYLRDAGARAVAFNAPFTEPNSGDSALAEAIDYAQSTADGKPPMPIVLAAPADKVQGRVAGQGLAFERFITPTAGLLGGSHPLVATNAVDSDGAVVRHVPLRVVAGDQHMYELPLAAVSAYLRRPPLEQELKLRSDGLVFTNRLVPTDGAYRMLINFEGPPFAFPHPSLSKVVAGAYPAQLFRDKLVFVGNMGATGLADNYPVPTASGTKMDTVEIWANAAQNLLNGKFVVPQSELTTILFMVVLSGLAAAGFFFWGAAGWLGAAAVVIVYSAGASWWTLKGLSSPASSSQIIPLPNIAYIAGNVVLVSGALFITFFIFEQRSRQAISQMFGKYLTPEVAKLVMDQQERGELALGGSVQTATIMFGDIRGFTTLSEGMEPEEVMGMLNRYFGHMVEIIEAHGGTISKFIGDNVMVMFNLPVEMEDNHALAAVRAGFEIQQWIQEYRAEHPEEKAAFGFGVSSGELVAGNMGSQERMEYTVIGDPVREADELCATALANEVAISESTYTLLNGLGVDVIDKGMVTIKGKTEQIHMYTVTGFAEEQAEDAAA